MVNSKEDLAIKLEEKFNYAIENQLDELDFFMDLINQGFTLEDFKKNIPDKYDYIKNFLEEHGFI